MTSQIRSRRPSSPWAVQYCSAVAPWPVTSWPTMSPTASSGRADTYGDPPASDTISGRAATANRARISEATMPTARSAYWPTKRSIRWGWDIGCCSAVTAPLLEWWVRVSCQDTGYLPGALVDYAGEQDVTSYRQHHAG